MSDSFGTSQDKDKDMNNTIKNLSDVLLKFRRSGIMLNKKDSPSKLSMDHLLAFLYVVDKEEVSLKKAEKALGLTQTHAWRLLTCLKDKGWVSLHKDPSHKRQFLASLTREGQDFSDYLEYLIKK